MNLNRPLTSLIPSLEGEVLTVLAGADTAFTGNQVHRLIGAYSNRGVRDALQRLCAQGIVISQSAGAADLYTLNQSHLLANYIKRIANVRTEFFDLLSREVDSWRLKPDCAAVFGSTVRKDMTTDSDIDIFISRPSTVEFGESSWRAQITKLALMGEKLTGNHFQIFELGNSEINQELKVKGGVIYSIIDDGVVFHGPKDYLSKLRIRKDNA